MRILIRIFINFITILLTEEVYYKTHMKIKYWSGTLFTGVVLPSIIAFLLLVIVNYIINEIASLRLSFNSNIIAGLIGTTIVIFFWLAKSFEVDGAMYIGKEIPNLLISTIVLVGILLIWFINFCIMRFLS